MEKNIELQKYVEDRLIPTYVNIIQKKNKSTGEYEYYPSIRVSIINNLNISEEEKNWIIEYLNDQDVLVRGFDPSIDGEYENYDYLATFKNAVLPKSLDPAETLAKLKLFKLTNDPIIREQIIVGNMRLVTYIAFKFAGMFEVDEDELDQYGYLGLINAVDTFDSSKGNSFSSYASQIIRYNIINGIKKDDHLKKIPKGVTILNEVRRIEREQGKPISEMPELIEELIDNLLSDKIIEEKDVKKVRSVIMLMGPSSTDELFKDGIDESKDIKTDIDPETIIIDKMTNEYLEKALSTLSEKEQKILRLRFGFDDGVEHTLEDIGKKLGITREGVRHAEARALRKLRNPYKYEEMRYYAFDDMDEPKSRGK